MNATRRKAIAAAAAKLREIISQIETLRDEEQEYHDNMPESFQEGERGEKAQTAIDVLEFVINDTEGAADQLESIE
jgi:uncharacterized coiled-coil DUF342 family protein